jgi:hypothetical protein
VYGQESFKIYVVKLRIEVRNSFFLKKNQKSFLYSGYPPFLFVEHLREQIFEFSEEMGHIVEEEPSLSNIKIDEANRTPRKVVIILPDYTA